MLTDTFFLNMESILNKNMHRTWYIYTWHAKCFFLFSVQFSLTQILFLMKLSNSPNFPWLEKLLALSRFSSAGGNSGSFFHYLSLNHGFIFLQPSFPKVMLFGESRTGNYFRLINSFQRSGNESHLLNFIQIKLMRCCSKPGFAYKSKYAHKMSSL